ncbi:hypothetical protein T439DRAFT_351313 [Meredithblackwellia eburnea MCA 4105]
MSQHNHPHEADPESAGPSSDAIAQAVASMRNSLLQRTLPHTVYDPQARGNATPGVSQNEKSFRRVLDLFMMKPNKEMWDVVNTELGALSLFTLSHSITCFAEKTRRRGSQRLAAAPPQTLMSTSLNKVYYKSPDPIQRLVDQLVGLITALGALQIHLDKWTAFYSYAGELHDQAQLRGSASIRRAVRKAEEFLNESKEAADELAWVRDHLSETIWEASRTQRQEMKRCTKSRSPAGVAYTWLGRANTFAQSTGENLMVLRASFFPSAMRESTPTRSTFQVTLSPPSDSEERRRG